MSQTSTPQLPIEIYERIIDFVAGSEISNIQDRCCTCGFTTSSLRTLAACALSSKWFLTRVRLHLYEHPTLRGDRQTCLFMKTIHDHRNLASYPASLTILTGTPTKPPPRYRPYSDPANPLVTKADPYPYDYYRPYPFHLVSHHLTGLREGKFPIQNLDIEGPVFDSFISTTEPRSTLRSPIDGPVNVPYDTICHPSFLKACRSYTNVHTLRLSHVHWSSFSFFARLVLCFPSLKTLALSSVSCQNYDTHPIGIARQKKIRLESLAIARAAFVTKLVPWLVESGMLQSVQELSLGDMHVASSIEEEERLNKCISDMIVAVRETLRSLCIMDRFVLEVFNFRLLKRLEGVTLGRIPLRLLIRILPTLPSMTLSKLTLLSYPSRGDGGKPGDLLAELDTLNTTLTSTKFYSLRELDIHMDHWQDWIANGSCGHRESKRSALIEEVDRKLPILHQLFRQGITCNLSISESSAEAKSKILSPWTCIMYEDDEISDDENDARENEIGNGWVRYTKVSARDKRKWYSQVLVTRQKKREKGEARWGRWSI